MVLARIRRAIRPRWYVAALRCLLPLPRGVTVVTVTWDSLPMLRHSVAAARRHSPAGTRIIIVDNGSTDGSPEWIATQPGVRGIFLDKNYGHGPGLDIGFLSARTSHVVALDVDAMPISTQWLSALLDPLDQGFTVSGVRGGALRHLRLVDAPAEWANRPDFVHPCCLAMKLRRFVFRRHTFRKTLSGRRMADPAEVISWREAGRLHYIEPTDVRGPGSLGQVHGGVVYHNAYGTRHRKQDTDLVDGIPISEVWAAWDEAVERYSSAGP